MTLLRVVAAVVVVEVVVVVVVMAMMDKNGYTMLTLPTGSEP